MLTERHQRILAQIVQDFVHHGEPVSSKSVVASGIVQVSSATIRNVMSELEHLGLLEQPHTSAGRVPTARGLRHYVDNLSGQKHLDVSYAAELRRVLETPGGHSLDEVARRISTLLSQLAELTSMVSLPHLHNVRLCDLRLSILANQRVLVMLITDDDRVHHRIVQMEQRVDPTQLNRMQNYLAELAIGLTLDQVRQRVRQEMAVLEREYSAMMQLTALSIGKEALEVARPEVYVEGALKFFDHAEFSTDTTKLRDILNMLEDKEQVLSLLDRLCESPPSPVNAAEPLVFIGPEIPWEGSHEMGVIVCGYERHGDLVGMVGLVGPMRMNYDRIIPLVAHTAKLLSSTLEEKP